MEVGSQPGCQARFPPKRILAVGASPFSMRPPHRAQRSADAPDGTVRCKPSCMVIKLGFLFLNGWVLESPHSPPRWYSTYCTENYCSTVLYSARPTKPPKGARQVNSAGHRKDGRAIALPCSVTRNKVQTQMPPYLLDLDADALQCILRATDCVPTLRQAKAASRTLATSCRGILSSDPRWESRRYIASRLERGRAVADALMDIYMRVASIGLQERQTAFGLEEETWLWDLEQIGSRSPVQLVAGLQEWSFDAEESETDARFRVLANLILPHATMQDLVAGLGEWDVLHKEGVRLLRCKAGASAMDDTLSNALEQMGAQRWPAERISHVLAAWLRMEISDRPEEHLLALHVSVFWCRALQPMQEWTGDDVEERIAQVLQAGVGDMPERAIEWLEMEWRDATQLGVVLQKWMRLTDTGARLQDPTSLTFLRHYFVAVPQGLAQVSRRNHCAHGSKAPNAWCLESRRTSAPLAAAVERTADIVLEAFACQPDREPFVAPEGRILEWLREQEGDGLHIDWECVHGYGYGYHGGLLKHLAGGDAMRLQLSRH